MSIQLIALRPYFDKKDKKEKKKHVFLGEADSVSSLIKNISTFIETIPDDQRWNVYYTALDCQNREETRGALRKFKSQKIIPFDLDGINLQKIQAYIEIFLDTLSLERDSTGIIYSGNGLQFLVELNEPFDKVEYFDEKRPFYKEICSKINVALNDAGLPGYADPSVWSPGRILRLPETENRKKGKDTKKAKVLSGNILPQKWDWYEKSGIPHLSKDKDFIEWSPALGQKLDKKAILSGCEFLKWILEKPGEVREPHFYAALSILPRLEKGRELAHKVAENIRDSGSDSSVASYSTSEIDQKIDQALTASGPRTCSNINNVWGNCNTCKFNGTINCPVSLKSKEFIATKDSGFHFRKNGKLYPSYNDLHKYFTQTYSPKVLADNGLIYIYNGTHYESFTEISLKAFAEEHFNPDPNVKTVNEFVQKVKRNNVVSADFFSVKNFGYINFKNGILDIKTGELKPHGPEWGFRYVLPYNYEPEAKAERFDRFLDEITGGDQSLRAILEEFGGYALSGDEYWIHKCLLLSGEGKNGKSKFQEALQLVAGEKNFSNLSISDLSNENNRQLMEGKLFNIAEEISHNEMRDTKHLKAIASGARQRVKLMWHQPYFIQLNAKLIFSCNTLPQTNDVSYGFMRRMIIVPFDQTFEGEKEDQFLLEKFKNELPGIFNIFLKGYKRLRKNKNFTHSDATEKNKTDYAKDNNIVAVWLEETDDVEVLPLNGRTKFATTEDLYNRFNDWISTHDAGNRFEALSFVDFGRMFTRAVSCGKDRLGRLRAGGPKKRGFYDVSVRQKEI